MSLVHSSVHAKWIMGKVIGTKMQKTAKARVTTPVMDPYLLKYYNKWKASFVHDGLWQCTAGDIMLLRALPHVKHELAKNVFKVGKVIDPVTGKPCAGTTYLESLLSSETTQLSKNLEELSISLAQ
uniref:Small ribosomal subunit protein uS17m n=1 Tax=Cercocebus atys TaxID=9531 RepID=A0A2K5LIU4_CERAT